MKPRLEYRALDSFNEWPNIEEGLNNKRCMAQCLYNIGWIYKKLKQTNQTISYFNQALYTLDEIKGKMKMEDENSKKISS